MKLHVVDERILRLDNSRRVPLKDIVVIVEIAKQRVDERSCVVIIITVITIL